MLQKHLPALNTHVHKYVHKDTDNCDNQTVYHFRWIHINYMLLLYSTEKISNYFI